MDIMFKSVKGRIFPQANNVIPGHNKDYSIINYKVINVPSTVPLSHVKKIFESIYISSAYGDKNPNNFIVDWNQCSVGKIIKIARR